MVPICCARCEKALLNSAHDHAFVHSIYRYVGICVVVRSGGQNMKQFVAPPWAPLTSAWTNRQLILTLTKREIASRYQGSLLGWFWSAFNPVFMLVVYTFVFSVVFQARWAGGSGSKIEFALMLFIGLIVFSFFAESVNRAPTLILGNASYVKKVVFPLEVLPWVVVLNSLFHAAVSLVIWLLAYTLFIGVPPVTVLLVPMVFLPLMLFTLGLCWILASLGVYLRDIAQMMPILTTVLMFLSPLFYPLDAVPKAFHFLFAFNPLAPAMEQMRAVSFMGKGIAWGQYAALLAGGACMAWAGLWWFQKTRRGFADVL